MTTHSETVVHTEGEFAIIRWKFWGFRCNSLTTSWIVQNNRTGEQVTICSRLRDAKTQVARLATPLRAQVIAKVSKTVQVWYWPTLPQPYRVQTRLPGKSYRLHSAHDAQAEAEAEAARVAAPLRAQLATAVDVDTAARMLAAI